MKKSILLLFLFSSILSFGQKQKITMPIDSITNLITYSEVVTIDSVSKNELYSRAREWFAKTFNSSKSVIQMDDKENGKIIGKASMHVYHKALGSNFPSGYINYTISVYLKDGRYKYEINGFNHIGELIKGGNRIPDYGPCEKMINTTDKVMGISYQKTYNYYLHQVDENINALVSDLKSALSNKIKNTESDNW